MTDRELLDLAAKAAQMIVFFSESTDCFWILQSPTNHHDIEWNPLEDDGDALRLAISLRMSISNNITEILVSTVSLTLAGIFIRESTFVQNTGAATRRAIVRAAAAEIGKAL